MKVSVRELVYGALLTSLAIIIPLYFRGWLQIVIPPFSATLASHVPVMLAMFVSPLVAALVGVGSTYGFFITLPPVIAARASIHIIFGVMGAILYRRGMRPWPIIALTAPVHAIGEALAVIPFGFTLQAAFVTVGIGTLLHHLMDAAISISLFTALVKAGVTFYTPARLSKSSPK
ncbi:MAG: ECF transporter S component [Peptococcaceae bacterium]|nr:ECF transporter S component [Peptococcaceae bacterium]